MSSWRGDRLGVAVGQGVLGAARGNVPQYGLAWHRADLRGGHRKAGLYLGRGTDPNAAESAAQAGRSGNDTTRFVNQALLQRPCREKVAIRLLGLSSALEACPYGIEMARSHIWDRPRLGCWDPTPARSAAAEFVSVLVSFVVGRLGPGDVTPALVEHAADADDRACTWVLRTRKRVTG